MHEIGALNEAIKLVEDIAAKNHIEKIKYITLEVGELCGFVPVFFEKYFPIVTEDKPVFQGARLNIKTVRGQALCCECESVYNVMKFKGCCPKCGSREKKILGGRQFMVKDIGY